MRASLIKRPVSTARRSSYGGLVDAQGKMYDGDGEVLNVPYVFRRRLDIAS